MTISSLGVTPTPAKNNPGTAGSPIATDRASEKRWGESHSRPLHMMVYCQTGPRASAVQDYANYLAELLDIDRNDSRIIARENPTCKDLVKQAEFGGDLIIVEKLNQSFMRKLVLGSPECRAIIQIGASMLFARQPNWPLKRILLVTRGQSRDDPAVDWLIRLTRPSGAFVTVLALQPYLSSIQCKALYGQGLTTWLTTYTPLGEQLRRIIDQTIHTEMESQLRLQFREGAPDWQVRCEIEEGNHNLLIVTADSSNPWEKRMPGTVVTPLLHRVNQPVLIAKPVPTPNLQRSP